MPRRNLNEKSVGALSANGTGQVDFWDTKLTGFALRAYSTGRKVFIVRHRIDGKVTQERLGEFPRMSAKDARELARDVLEGRESIGGQTIADFWPTFIEGKVKKGLKNGSLKNMRSVYEHHLAKPLGSMPMRDVRRRDIKRLLPDDRSPATRDGIRRIASAIWGVARSMEWGGVENNPADFKLDRRIEPRTRKFRRTEIERLWHEIGMMPTLQRSALQVIILTAQRMNQVLSMRWSELDGPTWKVPARELNKAGREVWVPLAPIVVKILDEIRDLELDDVFVFPSMRSDSNVGHMSRMSKTFKRLSKRAEVEDARCHDWRRTFTSLAIKPVRPNDPAATPGLGLTIPLAAACLSHAPEGHELAWNHYMDAEDRALYLMPERRRAMGAWADFILDVIKGV